jgi:hypothetical protein
MVVKLSVVVFGVVMPCNFVDGYHHFGGMYHLHLQGSGLQILNFWKDGEVHSSCSALILLTLCKDYMKKYAVVYIQHNVFVVCLVPRFKVCQ